MERRAVMVACLAAVGIAGCGGGSHPRAPEAAPPAAPLARPALSPPPRHRLAGHIVHVGSHPDAIAADPRSHVFAVAIHDPSRLVLVDSRSGRVTDRVEVPVGTSTPPRVIVTPAVFLVPAETGTRAVAIAPATRTAPTGVGPPAATVVLGRTFVADARTHRVDVLDRGRAVAHLAGIRQPGGLTATGIGNALAVVDAGRRTLDLYDPRSLRRLASTPAGRGPTNVVAFGDRLYVADTGGDAVLAFSTQPRLHRLARTPLPGAAPYGLALDPARLRLHITLTATNTLLTLPIDGSGAPRRRTPTVRQPDAVAVDSLTGTVAVAGRADGLLQLLPDRAGDRGR